MTALLFVGFLGLLVEHVGKPLVVILDNASVHKAKEIEPLLKVLQGKGLKLYFLPPYSPELNRIEKLWHKMKSTNGWPSNRVMQRHLRPMWTKYWPASARNTNWISADLLRSNFS